MAKSKSEQSSSSDSHSSNAHSDRMAKLVIAMIALVGIVGLVNVWNSPTGAANLPTNPGYYTFPYNANAFYCESQADCSFDEVCARARAPNNGMKSCQKSHVCARDMDCGGLGSSPVLMKCVNNWCKVDEFNR